MGQVIVLPQPSGMVWPQVAVVHTAGEQHVLLPARQTWLPLQLPQESVPPQPSDIVPQPFAGHVALVQHWWLTQVWLLPQLGQVRVLPQPSPMEPHCAPEPAQLVGVQHAPEVQKSPGAQLPASRVLPQPSS